MTGHWRTLRESQEFTEKVKQLGNTKHIDEALRILLMSIATKPEKFNLIPGHHPIQLAFTDPYKRNGVKIPDQFTIKPVAKIIVTPKTMKNIIEAFNKNLERFEERSKED